MTLESWDDSDDTLPELSMGTLDDLINEIEAAWGELAALSRGLTAEQMLAPETAGEWSLKDLFAHIAAWEEEAARRINEIVQGNGLSLSWPTREQEDAFNAEAVSGSRALSVDQVLKRLEECHQDLMDLLATFGDELLAAQLEVPATEWIPGWTYMHYQHHAADIWQARSRTER